MSANLENPTKKIPLESILFRLHNHPTYEYECMLAGDLGEGCFKLANFPVLAFGVAFEDIVHAQPNEAGELEFVAVLRRSGASNVRFWLKDPDRLSLDAFLGCTLQYIHKRLFVLHIPRKIDPQPITLQIERLQREGVLSSWEVGYKNPKFLKPGKSPNPSWSGRLYGCFPVRWGTADAFAYHRAAVVPLNLKQFLAQLQEMATAVETGVL